MKLDFHSPGNFPDRGAPCLDLRHGGFLLARPLLRPAR